MIFYGAIPGKSRRHCSRLIAALLFLAASHSAFGLDPDRTITQFYHTAWTVQDGAPSGIYRLAQTRDGYLWLATLSGLSRFDGVRFQHYQPERGDPFPSKDISALLATPEGGLWIGFRTGGATFLENGRGHSYGEREGLPSSTLREFALDREGAIWAGSSRGLFRFANSRWNKIGTESGFFSEQVVSLFVDNRGKLWVNGDTDLYCLSPGERVFQKRKLRNNGRIRQTPDGALWLSEPGTGIRAVYGPLAESYDESKAALRLPIGATVLVDREGSFWMSMAENAGVRRVSKPEQVPGRIVTSTSSLIQKFTLQDGLTSDSVNAMLEDHEGNIWIATSAGLDRFRRRHFVQGPSPAATTGFDPLLVVDRKGIIWEGSGRSLVTPASDGVSVRESLQLGSTIVYRGSFPQMTCGWRDFEGVLWFGGNGTITRWTGGRSENVEFPDKDLAHLDVQSITGDRTGDLWVSIQQHGVYRRHDGAWAQYGKLPGLPKSTAVILWADNADRIWFGYMGNQIALLDGDRVRTFSSADGLHVGNVLSIGGHRDHIWAAGQFGLALFDGNKFHTIAGEADSDFGGVSGVVETASGDFWLNMATGVARIPAAEIANRFRDPHHKLQSDFFDFRDGVKGTATPIRPLPSAVEAGDGRIWMSGSNGVYWIDPARIYKNPIPPPVTIEAIYAGDQRFTAFEASRLPRLPQSVRIEYTALSLSIPERVRFRYRLEGYDEGWQEVGTRRTAFYPKLPPGHFRFHVIASNNDGVWNQTGAIAEIVVPPALYQTEWFKALCVCAGLALLWQIYFWRLRQISAQMHGRLEARLAERERIARDLHDTLLQSFQGLMLRLQVVDELLPPGRAKEQLEQTLERADRAIVEGRGAVHDLRSSATTANDLAQAVRAVADELATEGSPTFRLVVEGPVRDLHPILRDEVYRIAREGLLNSFTHARAHHIEAEITYSERIFRLRIRDDGTGIPPDILQAGRSGHYGLSGIRERARQIGANMAIWSGIGTGTEIDLSVPGAIAYSKSLGRPRLQLFRKKVGA